MTKFNNPKVKKVKSNLKLTKSKLIKKRTTLKGRNTKKATVIEVSRRKRHHAKIKRQHAKRHHAKSQQRKKASRKEATRKEASRKEPTRKKASRKEATRKKAVRKNT